MYLAGVSVRRVEDVTELLWGRKHVRGRRQAHETRRLGRHQGQAVREYRAAEPTASLLFRPDAALQFLPDVTEQARL